MGFIADNIWKILFIILCCVFGWFAWEKKKQKEMWERLAKSFGGEVADLQAMKPAKQDMLDWEQRYWKLLGSLNQTAGMIAKNKIPIYDDQDEKRDPKTMDRKGALDIFIRKAGLKAGYKYGESSGKLLSEIFLENYKVLDEAGIFSDAENLRRLTSGIAPVAVKGPFAGAPLCLTNRVPPQLWPELINHPCNVMVIPDSAAALIGNFVDQGTDDFAGKMLTAGLIKPPQRNKIRTLYQQIGEAN